MRIILTILFLISIHFFKAQESFRSFNEVNPAQETYLTDNVAFRSIHNENALYNYFHIHTNKLHRLNNTGLDIQTKSFDVNSSNYLKAMLKANYQFRITRRLSIYSGIGVGINHSKNANNGFIIPGISLITKKFSFGFNSEVTKLNSTINWNHSIQSNYTFTIYYGKKIMINPITGKKSRIKNLKINIAYLNYINSEIELNQFFITQVELKQISLLTGCNYSRNQKLQPMIGTGVKINRLSINFQSVFNSKEISEIQISMKYNLRLLSNYHRPFRVITMPDF